MGWPLFIIYDQKISHLWHISRDSFISLIEFYYPRISDFVRFFKTILCFFCTRYRSSDGGINSLWAGAEVDNEAIIILLLLLTRTHNQILYQFPISCLSIILAVLY